MMKSDDKEYNGETKALVVVSIDDIVWKSKINISQLHTGFSFSFEFI